MKNKFIRYCLKNGYFKLDYQKIMVNKYHIFGENPTAIYIKKKGFQVVFFVQQKTIIIPYHQPSIDLVTKVLTKIPFKNKAYDVRTTRP